MRSRSISAFLQLTSEADFWGELNDFLQECQRAAIGGFLLKQLLHRSKVTKAFLESECLRMT